jgi:hypothetical protein
VNGRAEDDETEGEVCKIGERKCLYTTPHIRNILIRTVASVSWV